jgi:hypothetical protein
LIFAVFWWCFWLALGFAAFIAIATAATHVFVSAESKLFIMRLQLDNWWRNTFNFNAAPKPLVLPDLPKSDEPEMVDFTPYRMEHMHVIGGTGAGKTTLLEHRISDDLSDPEEPSIVVIDSQTALVQKLSRLAAFSDDHSDERYLNQRIIIVDPRDQPAMNPFAIDRKRLEKYDKETRYQVEQGIIQTFDYLFTSVLGADLTTRQNALFRNTARLMVSLPQTLGRNATMIDVLNFMENPDPYIPAIETLTPVAQKFFSSAFFNKETSRAYRQTREQVAYRLYALLEDPVLVKIFSAETNELDLFNRLNIGYLFLVDTAQEYLRDASSIFGSLFICNLLQVIQERGAPNSFRSRCHIYIDEAQEYFNQADDMIEGLLTQARKQNVGLCFAHHFKQQCSPKLWASFMANTAIKFASGISADDASALARDYRCEPKDLLSLPRHTWACFVKGMENKPFPLNDGPSPFDNLPRMTEEEYREFRNMNRVRLTPSRLKSTAEPRPIITQPLPIYRGTEITDAEAEIIEPEPNKEESPSGTKPQSPTVRRLSAPDGTAASTEYE